MFFFVAKKVLTQILGAGDVDRLEQVEKNVTTLVTLIYAQDQQLHFQCIFVSCPQKDYVRHRNT